MRYGSLIFAILTVFFGVTSPIYWVMSHDPTGTAALVLTALLCFLIAFYTFWTSRSLPAQPEDDKEGEIADAAGEYGFFSPGSWWPLACAASLATFVLGIPLGVWLMVVGGAFGIFSLLGLVFQYYRREHEH